MPVEFSAEVLKARLRGLMHELPRVVEKEMRDAGDKMIDDIVTDRSHINVPTSKFTGKRYFDGENQSVGLIDIIRETRRMHISVEHADKNVSFGFGHISTLDSLAPYWIVFERDVPGRKGPDISIRKGMSETEFIPAAGMGKTGEGYAVDSEAQKLNPGVLGVNLFGDVWAWYKPIMDKKIAAAIKEIIDEGKKTSF